MFKKYRLYFQIALASFTSIMVIEGLLMIGAYHSKVRELKGVRSKIHEAYQLESKQEYKGLSDDEIHSRAKKHLMNILWLSLLISAFVGVSTLIIYHYIAGRHIHNLVWLNKLYTANNDRSLNIQLYSKGKMPNNEIGELIDNFQDLIQQVRENELHMERNLKEAKSQLMHSAKLSAIGELIGGLLHDIGNPLTVILGKSNLLSRTRYIEKQPTEKIVKGCEQIYTAAQSIDNMVKRVGEYGRNQIEYKEGVRLFDVIESSLLFTHSKLKRVMLKSLIKSRNNSHLVLLIEVHLNKWLLTFYLMPQMH
jgi:signal transduction histidine kinase